MSKSNDVSTQKPGDGRPTPLRRYLTWSLIAHALLIGTITVSLLRHQEQVSIQEAAFVEELRARQETERQRMAEELRQAAEAAMAERLAEQIQAEMEQLIAEQLPPTYEEALSSSMEQQVATNVDEAAMNVPEGLEALDFEALAQLMDELRGQSLEEMRADLAAMKRDLLLSQVRSYIRSKVVPQVQSLIEERLRSEAGPVIERALASAAAAGRPAPTPEAQREIVRQTIEKVREKVGEELKKEVEATAVPAAASRMTQALDRELKARKVDVSAFREFLEKDIRQALAEGMKEMPPAADPAMARVQERFDLQDPEALEAAKKAAEAAAKALAELAARQQQMAHDAEAMKDEVQADAGKAEMEAARERALGAEMAQNRKAAERATAQARRVTLAPAAAEAAESAKDTTAETRADEAATSMERQQPEESSNRMQEAAAALRQQAAAMEKLAADLGTEAEKARARQAEAVKLAEALGEQKAEEAMKRAEAAGEKAAEQEVKKAVQRGVSSLKLEGILGEEADAEALAQMEALEGKLAHTAELLAGGRGLAGEMGGAALAGPGPAGAGPGGIPGEGWGLRTGQASSRMNREAYEKFMKHMRERLKPGDYYSDDSGEVEGLDYAARGVGQPVPERIFVAASQTRPADPASAATAAAAERKIPEPPFPTTAFGGAAMMEKRPVIDGDLSDWGELRHGLVMQYQGREEKIDGGPTVYVRWSPDGFYMAYTVKDPGGIQPCPEQPWNGDCLELMIDLSNTRLETAFRNPYAQKFCFTPFGCRGSTAVTVWEMGRGLRGLAMAKDYPDLKGTMGKSAARRTADGYSVEIFLSRDALVSPVLVPGKYVALNFSLNVDIGKGYQWSASQFIGTWQRPDTWGDVLLLGSDAKIRFIAADLKSDEAVGGIVPGMPLGLEVTDADMNLNTLKIDRVAAELKCRGLGTSLFVILRETGPNTGVFRVSVDTQAYFLPAAGNTLNIRSGDVIELVYNDARTEYGETNRQVSGELPAGWPVLKMAEAAK